MNNQEIAKKVIDALGGRENVNSVAHCATRLRVMVKDEGKINKEVIENLEKVQGAFFNSGQYQIIFGTGTVNKMYDEVVALGLPTSSKDDMKAEAAKQGNWFQRAIRTFGDVFVPIIPVIVATGLFMGVRGLFNALEMPLPGDFATYTQILTDTAFIILPGLVVWSTFRVFGGNPAVGIVLGMMLVSGSLPNAWAVAQGGEVTAMNFFGFIPVVGLQGSVLPAFIIGVVGAKFEKAVRKVVPDVIDLLVTPFVTLLVMSILGLFVIGPVFHIVENYILIATKAILSMPFGLGGFLIGGVHQLIVVSGVHHIFNLLEVQLLAADHANPFNAIITAAMTAQGAATVAVGVKTKNPKLKNKGIENSEKVEVTTPVGKCECRLTEFVGLTTHGHGIGLVIANVDPALHEAMGLDKKYRSIGIIGARTGAGPFIMAADEAVKATNTEVISIELPRDTEGGAGHGSLILFGAEDVSDVKRAVEVAINNVTEKFGDVYANSVGHIELQYTARASYAVNKAFGAPLGKAFGLIVGAPAAIGVVIADVALKAASVEALAYSSPSKGTSYSNESILAICGDSGAVKQAILAAKEVGVKLLEAMGGEAPSASHPYI